jgi:ferric-dicitrate binding protein FerR (iron transport regulator)
LNTIARFTHLLDKYLANTCLPSEKDELFEMLSNPDYEDLVNQKMLESWNCLDTSDDSISLSKYDLFQRINEGKSAHLKVSKTTKTNTKWYWAAASFIFFASLTIALFLSRETVQINQEDWTSFSAGIGERKYMILPDSSEIWLNSGSTIRFPVDFLTRSVTLTGEAFFEVKRDTLRPFRIHTGEIVTQVLGTSFNIRSFEEDPEVKVTVSTGKVGVGKENLPFASLLPNQQISYQKNSGDFSFNEIDAASLSSWREGNLVFENITFGEAAITLQKHFGIEFLFDNESLSKCKFSAKFDLSEDLDHVLEVLTKLNGISSREENTKVYFIGTKCL